MAIAKLQNTITKEQMQKHINANPRLLKLQQEIQAQNAKVDAMINRISTALEKGDEAAAFNEFPGGKQMLAVLNQEQPAEQDARKEAVKKLIQAKKAIYAAKGSPVSAPDSEIRKTIASKIRPFSS